MSYQELPKECIKRWKRCNDDDRVENFKINFDSWLDQFSDEMIPIITNLLRKFDYYSHEYVIYELKKLHANFISLNFDKTAYIILKSKDKHFNSSDELMAEYRLVNKISKYSIIPDLSNVDLTYTDIDNLIIIDDFCGTAKTVIDFLSPFVPNLTGKNIYYVVIHIMDEALDRIQEFKTKYNINITVYNSGASEKAFVKLPAGERKAFESESQRLGLKESDIFGYKNSEALVAMYNNTPNNTLGVFAKSTEKYWAIFPRNNDKRPNWYKMKSDKVERSKKNIENSAKKYSNEELS